jgi:serine/threonine protein kinase
MKTIKNKTRKIKIKNNIYLLNKSKQSSQLSIPSFITNCNNRELIGKKTLDIKPRYYGEYDEALQVIKGELKDYKEPIVMKVYKTTSHLLNIELYIYKLLKQYNYKYYVKPICIFSCNDFEDKYNRRVDVTFKNLLIPCSKNADERYTFIIYKYLSYGDISDFTEINNITSKEIILNIYKHLIFRIAELVCKVKVIHGDLNSGNILINKTNEESVEYNINGKTYNINLYGYEPLLIDFGRSHILDKKVPIDNYLINEELTTILVNIIRYHSKNYQELIQFLTELNTDLYSFDRFYNETIELIEKIL